MPAPSELRAPETPPDPPQPRATDPTHGCQPLVVGVAVLRYRRGLRRSLNCVSCVVPHPGTLSTELVPGPCLTCAGALLVAFVGRLFVTVAR